MFTLTAPSPRSLRRLFTRSVFTLTVLLCLSAGLLFTGCQIEPEEDIRENTHFRPVGVWVAFDKYTITETTVNYFCPESTYGDETYPSTELIGDIVAAVDFSDNAGVLIIKITSASTGNNSGKYTGVYYNNYTNSDTGTPIQMATAIDKNYLPVETDTMKEAASLFIAGNTGSHVSMWGDYTKE